DDNPPEALRRDRRDGPTELGDDRLPLGLAPLEQLDDPQEATDLLLRDLEKLLHLPLLLALVALLAAERDAALLLVLVAELEALGRVRVDVGDTRQLVRRCDAARVERPHRELRPRLADRLRRDNADGDPDFDLLAGRKVTAVAGRADALARLTGEH